MALIAMLCVLFHLSRRLVESYLLLSYPDGAYMHLIAYAFGLRCAPSLYMRYMPCFHCLPPLLVCVSTKIQLPIIWSALNLPFALLSCMVWCVFDMVMLAAEPA